MPQPNKEKKEEPKAEAKEKPKSQQEKKQEAKQKAEREAARKEYEQKLQMKEAEVKFPKVSIADSIVASVVASNASILDNVAVTPESVKISVPAIDIP